MQPFSNGEMERRQVGLRAVMAEVEVEAVIATSFHNVLYYSNFCGAPGSTPLLRPRS